MKHYARTIFFPMIVAVWCLALPLAADAAGLGPIKVNSALGQPFQAVIEITGLPNDEFELELSKGSLASPETYEDARLPYPALLRQIRISAERGTDGKPFLRLSSNAPINEPALNLLVEFTWRGGRLMQKYSILLDPPK